MVEVLNVVSWACLLLGSFFIIVGGIGLLRLPDFYTRIHAGGIIDTFGAGLLLIGLTLKSPDVEIAIKLILVMVFLMFTSPTSGHALAKAAYLRGLKPWTGKETDHDAR